MCKTLRILPIILLATALALPGCKSSSTTVTPAALAPGYLNQADQLMGQTLAAARSFYSQLQSDIQSGKYTPSPTEKTALDNFATTLNVAQVEYLAYHNGAQTQAQAQAAVNAVASAQAQLQAAFPPPVTTTTPGNSAS